MIVITPELIQALKNEIEKHDRIILSAKETIRNMQDTIIEAEDNTRDLRDLCAFAEKNMPIDKTTERKIELERKLKELQNEYVMLESNP